jgi:hypothetical protein
MRGYFASLGTVCCSGTMVQCIQMAKYDAEREILPRKDSDRILVQKCCSCSWFSIQDAFVAGGSKGARRRPALTKTKDLYYSAQGSGHHRWRPKNIGQVPDDALIALFCIIRTKLQLGESKPANDCLPEHCP